MPTGEIYPCKPEKYTRANRNNFPRQISRTRASFGGPTSVLVDPRPAPNRLFRARAHHLFYCLSVSKLEVFLY